MTRHRHSLWLAWILSLLIPLLCPAAEPFAMPSPLPGHPRLLVNGADWERARALVKSGDPGAALLFDVLQERGKRMLEQPPAERVLEGRRLLPISRLMLERICVLSTLANITEDDAYAARAIAELRAAVRFSDWHPEVFLDTAELALAVAIGYDWLYEKLIPADRAEIETALIEKGIKPSIPAAGQKAQWWVTGNNNWNQVCHASLAAAAIAVADREPELGRQIVQRAIDNVPIAARCYGPDGVYPEGVGYWDYGTSFEVLLIAALDRLCGRNYGLDALPGFAQTPLYLSEMTSPSEQLYNYSDVGVGRFFNVPFFWFSQRLGHPEWARGELDWLKKRFPPANGKVNGMGGRLFPFALLWYKPESPEGGGAAPIPLQWLGRGENPVAVHRSALGDVSATYVGIKGGSPSGNHAHMDGGSFIMEADGVRWALDLGMEDYNRVETLGVDLWNMKQESQRWELFRLGAESHNLLRFNGAKQAVKGNGQFVRFHADGAQGHSVLDLTSLYPGLASVQRDVVLLPSRAVLFQDEWTAGAEAVDVSWQWITKAAVQVRPGEIELTQNGKRLTLRLLAPADVRVEVRPAQDLQQWADADNPGVKRIDLKTRTAAGETGSFRVLAVPGSCPGTEAPALKPLRDFAEK